MTDQTSRSKPRSRPLGLRAYRLASHFVRPFVPFILKGRLKRGKENEERIAERFGYPSIDRPSGGLIWVHAASVGESLSILPLIDYLYKADPSLSVLMTTGTVTSAKLLAKRLPPNARHQFVPVDMPDMVDRFLDYWHPQAGLWVESEIWPNLIAAAEQRRIPLALVNARMSDKSFRNWSRWPATIRYLLGGFSVCLAQNNEIAELFTGLGAQNVRVLGNLKYVSPPLPVNEDELNSLEKSVSKRPRWLASSTHPGEEEWIANAHVEIRKVSHKFLTIVVPRHPERGPEIAETLAAMGLSVALRSAGEPIEPETDIYVADSVGELGLFYRVCDVAFIGGSLVPHGGQNPLEAARLGCAVLHGPHVFNFDTVYRDMDKDKAALGVESGETLSPAVFELLHNEKKRKAMIKAAGQFAERGNDLLNQHVAALTPFLREAFEMALAEGQS